MRCCSPAPGVEPEPADFELASVSVPAPRDGEVTVRNVLTSVDPYMLPRMQGRSSYASPFPLGEPVAADGIGEVVASAHLGVPVGSWLVSHSGWRTYATMAGSPADVIDRQIGDPVAWLSVLGMTGFTAWFGLHDIGRVRPGETVLVNAAVGAVGSVVVQLAVHAGARVVEWLAAPRSFDTSASSAPTRRSTTTRPRSTRRSLERASPAWTCFSTTSAADSSRAPCRSCVRMGASCSAAG